MPTATTSTGWSGWPSRGEPMSLWPIPIEVAILLAAFLVYPLSLVLMIAVSLLPSRSDRLSSWALALANGVLCYAIYATFDAIDDRLHIGARIARLAVFAFVGVTAAALACLAARRSRDARPTRTGRAVFCVAIGVACPFILLFWIVPFARWPGAIVFALLGLGAAACLHQARASWPPEAFRTLYRATSAVMAASLLAAIGIGLFSAAKVAQAAQDAAAGRRYCIHPTGGFLDLSMLTFREPRTGHRRPAYENDHGLLVVETQTGPIVLNWSYRDGSFRPDYLSGGLSPTASELCRPQ